MVTCMRTVATLLKKFPWLIIGGRILWRITQPKFTAGVVGVIFNDEGKILLVEHVFHPSTPWGLPGGWIGRGENPSDTLIRELQEELQLKVELGPLLLAETEFGNHFDFAYMALSTAKVGQLSSELLQYGWYDLSELPSLHHFHWRAIETAMKYRQVNQVVYSQ